MIVHPDLGALEAALSEAVARFDAVATFLRREKPGCGAIK
jgi:hypothetical protein